jgi:nicotinate-nucleotide pyrophosphorylase
MATSTIRVSLPQMYAAEVAEIIRRRCMVFNYDVVVEVDEATQADEAIKRELDMAMRSEPDPTPSPYAFDVVG